MFFIEPDSTTSKLASPALPDSTFLVVDTSVGSDRPLFAASTRSRLGSGAVFSWSSLEGVVYVHTATGTDGVPSTVAAAKFYLEKTTVPGTSRLKWCDDQIACEGNGDLWIAIVRTDRATTL